MAQELSGRFYDAWSDFTPDEDRACEAYSGKELLLPELEIVGRLRFRKAMQNALHPVRHKDWLEILYMEHGQVDWWVEDSECTESSINKQQQEVITNDNTHENSGHGGSDLFVCGDSGRCTGESPR